jgi:hypothetical protein
LTSSARSAAQEEPTQNHVNLPNTTSPARVDSTTPVDPNAPVKNNLGGSGSFVVAPLPISSPALGSGIIPILGYIFSLGPPGETSASVIGAAGLVTDNGSRGIVLGGELYFRKDTYRTTAIYARGNLNYNLYGLGAGSSQPALPLKQDGQVFFGELLRRIKWKFSLGPRFFSGSSLVTQRTPGLEPAQLPPDLGLQTSLKAIGFRVNRDARANHFYPTAGTLVDFTSDFFFHALGSKYAFQAYRLTFNQYRSVTRNQVFAYSLFACATGGQPPFYGNCIYGTNDRLRGYIAGQYLDRYMVTAQVEYRVVLPWRFGAVGFAGTGEVIPGGNQPFRSKNFLPSAGGGLRFQLSRKYHLNLRADAAQGKGSHTWSMSVGEAF